MIFHACDFITDWSIASYQELFNLCKFIASKNIQSGMKYVLEYT